MRHRAGSGVQTGYRRVKLQLPETRKLASHQLKGYRKLFNANN